jgi:cbb3-type cytochrome oxidase subunit 3
MFKQFITSLQGDQIYMLISLMVFFSFFIGATIVLIKMKKNHLDYMSNIPLKEKKEAND